VDSLKLTQTERLVQINRQRKGLEVALTRSRARRWSKVTFYVWFRNYALPVLPIIYAVGNKYEGNDLTLAHISKSIWI